MSRSLIICAVCLSWAVYSHAQQGGDIPNIAVMDLEGKGVSGDEASVLTEKLRGELIGSGRFQVIERASVDQILKEQGFQQTGCTSNECMVEAGQLLGVRYIVAGSIGKIEDTYLLSVRLINVASGKIEMSVQREIRGKLTDVLKDGIPKAAAELSQGSIPGAGPQSHEADGADLAEGRPAVKRERPAPDRRRFEVFVAFSRSLGNVEFTGEDTAGDSRTHRLTLHTNGIRARFGVRFRYQYLGLGVLFAAAGPVKLSEVGHSFDRSIAGGSLTWYYERLRIRDLVLFAPGISAGYWRVSDHGTYRDEPSKQVNLDFNRFLSPRIKFQMGKRAVHAVFEYSVLLGTDSRIGSIAWRESTGTLYNEGAYKINLVNVFDLGISFCF